MNLDTKHNLKSVSAAEHKIMPHLLSFVQHLGHLQFIFDAYSGLTEEIASLIDEMFCFSKAASFSLNALFCGVIVKLHVFLTTSRPLTHAELKTDLGRSYSAQRHTSCSAKVKTVAMLQSCVLCFRRALRFR